MKHSKTVNEYLEASGEWKDVVSLLREIVVAEDVEETIKWGSPAYLVDNKIVIGIGAFKSYAGLWFHQGVLLKDKADKLINASENKTRALRQWRFASYDEVKENAALIREYVREAIANQKAGKMVKPRKKEPFRIPDELKAMLDSNKELARIFKSMPPSHQREYAEYIGEAKRAETRLRRIEKIKPMILDSKGLNDKYRK